MSVNRLALAASMAVAVSVICIAGPAERFSGEARNARGAGIEQPAQGPNFGPGILNLRTGDVRTEDLVDLRTVGIDQFEPPDRARYVIQLDGPITPQRRDALEAMGVVLHDYIPAYAYIAELHNVQPQQLAATDFVIWTGEYQDEWKLDPKIGLRPFQTPERIEMKQRGEVGVIITLFANDDTREVLAGLRHFPNAVVHFTDEMGGNPIISATIMLEDVPKLAEFNSVQFVDEAWEVTPRNNEARWVVQSNVPGLLPLYDQGIRGEDQVIGILDTRIRHDHCAFHDPSQPPPSGTVNPDHRKIIAYNETLGSSGHGTHVAGTAAGDPGDYNNNRGVAYMSKIVYATWPSFTEAGILQRFNLHHSQGGRLHTNSWGNDGTTAYDGLARGIDVFQWNEEESQTFWAVTNTSTMKNPENAKNTLAVGATSKAPNQHQHCTGGAGPTNDGRRKPEIYAPGCSTVSASTSACGTTSNSGTSMASPAVAGVAALARQYYMDGFYPTGDPGSGEPFTPSGALVKATLLNSSVPMTGASGGYPGNVQGWGRVLADDALYFVGDSRRLYIVDIWNADGLTTGQVYEDVVHVVDAGEKLKVTLVWTDYPGAAGTSFAAVNDLDLEVISPSGTLYRGNVFSGGVSVTGGSKDDRNNVEQVHVATPEAGPWTIRVVGAAVNQQKQGFALVTTGDIVVQEPPLIVSLPQGAPGLIAPGDETEFQVRISPGEENIVAGSEKLFYRFDGGSFISADLEFIGDDIYIATLPAPNCDDVPQFYVQAEGDGGTVRTSPLNAPESFFQANVGHIEIVDVFYENFEGGMPSGWSATGLWHVTSSCAVSGNCDGNQWAYYGQSGSCNYDTGSANQGTMTSTPIEIPQVPAGGSVTLSFCWNCQTESSSAYDIPRFSINGQNWIQFDDSSSWTTFTLDITEHAGQSITLHWHFDTIDGILNNFRGWQIDAVEIVAEGLECDDVSKPCPADLDGDGIVDISDLLILLGAWGPNPGHPADLDGDGVVDVSDMLILLGDWGDCD